MDDLERTIKILKLQYKLYNTLATDLTLDTGADGRSTIVHNYRDDLR